MRRSSVARLALPVLALGSLAGCSTMSEVGNTFTSMIPWGGGGTGSGAPYVGDIQPTVAKAAPEAPRVRGSNSGPEPAQAVPYSTAPSAVEEDAKPTARGSDSRRSDVRGLDRVQFAEAKTTAAPPPARKPTAEEKKEAIDPGRRSFQDDGSYPNLSTVPPRPTDLPNQAEISARLKSMQDERSQAMARSIRPPGPPSEAIPEVAGPSPGQPAGQPAVPGLPDAVAVQPTPEPASPATAVPPPRPDGSPRTELSHAPTLIV
jgi:hypothetical protein